MKNKVVVTGGLGYIGSHTVVALLENGYEPIIIDNLENSSLEVINGIFKITGIKPSLHIIDCKVYIELETVIKNIEGICGIIHFAAYKSVNESIEKSYAYYENNILSLINVIKIADKYAIENIVFSSSCTVYGNPLEQPVTENMPFGEITNPYGKSKMMCEEILKDFYISSAKHKVISLRYFNPIGAHTTGLIGELPNGIPNNLLPYITKVASGKLAKLKVFGNDYNTKDGTCMRDFIHVCDLADAHISALNYANSKENKNYDVFNIGTGIPTSVLELITTFEKVNNIKIDYEFTKRRAGDIESIYAKTDKAAETLSWKSKRNISQSLKDAWNWELKNNKHD
ncbi:MAG: UDP-glucose 4-epimerase GalE [Bacteroidetes bacterium]|nr:MAG: UDP-glucose 4-epimerase GalE [Bacteroidota bacterium]